MRYITLLLAGVILLASLAASVTEAATPTPAATSTAIPTTTPGPRDMQLNFSVDPPLLYWERPLGAATYRLLGSVSAVAANAADPFCTPAIVPQSKDVEIDTELAADTTSFAVPIPALAPEDKWFIASIHATIITQDAVRATIAAGGISFAAETVCGGPPSPPDAIVLTEDTMINGCLIPAGFIEVTTQNALDHGQRVFAEVSNQANRYYIRFRTGACVHLLASADMPFPEFAPDDLPLSPPGVADDLPLSPPRTAGDPRPIGGVVRAPDTGDGPGEGRHAINASSTLIIAASAIVLVGGGLALRRRRR